VNTRLVGECRASSNAVVERNFNANLCGNNALQLSDQSELVLGLYKLRVHGVHAANEGAERGNSITLANTENTGINVSRSIFKGSEAESEETINK
jgi:hypothetical protein